MAFPVKPPRVSRRSALRTAAFTAGAALLGAPKMRAAEAAESAVETAHGEIWRRFIDQYNVLLDYAELDGSYPRPTPEENREGKPNALSWWTATENGSMFNGSYLDGAIARWKQTKSSEDRDRAFRLVKGLLLLGSVGPKGFIARGVATDGQTPPPMGSNDQTGPWFYGLWRAVHEGLVEGEERKQVIAKFTDVASALESTAWKMPCVAGAPSPFRGSFAMFSWEGAPRLLFLLKATHQLTGDSHWAELYTKLAHETGGTQPQSRLDICAAGMVFHNPKSRECWTGASSVAPLRALWEMEADATLRAAYARGLDASVRLAAEGVPLALQFNNEGKEAFLGDWRKLLSGWLPQKSEAEAVEVAEAQARELGKMSPRRYQEFKFVREPAYASWLVTLHPDRAVVETHRDALLKTLAHFRYERLYYSQFFPVEAAWWRLRALGLV